MSFVSPGLLYLSLDGFFVYIIAIIIIITASSDRCKREIPALSPQCVTRPPRILKITVQRPEGLWQSRRTLRLCSDSKTIMNHRVRRSSRLVLELLKAQFR